MATKSMTLNQVKNLGDTVFANWDEAKNSIHLSGIALFRLITLKTKIMSELDRAQEAIAAIAYNCGGEEQPNGTIKIPDERLPEANRALRELGNEVIEIEYTPVVFRDCDSMPITLMEALIDFIEIQE